MSKAQETNDHGTSQEGQDRTTRRRQRSTKIIDRIPSPKTAAGFKKWLRLQLELSLEWLAVGYGYTNLDPDWPIDEARRLALKFEKPEIAKLCVACREMSEAAEVLSACLAELNKSDWVDLREAARIIGCSESGLRKLVKRNVIQCAQSRKHGRLRFRREWLKEFLEPEKRQRKPGVKAMITLPKPASKLQVGFDPALLNL